MRKILLAVGVFVLFGIATTFAVINFPDVRITDWFYDAVNFATDHNYINGIGGRFEPSRTVTRDQTAVMLYKFASNMQLTSGTKIFRDSWYGFELTFPNDWKGYLYEVKFSTDCATMCPLAVYNFGLNDNNHAYRPLLNLTVYERGIWESIREEAVNQTLVSQNSSYAVISSSAQSVSPELTAAHSAISSITGSFRWSAGS